jgi:hypothetical protein
MLDALDDTFPNDPLKIHLIIILSSMQKVHYTTFSNLSILYLHLANYQKKINFPVRKTNLPNSTLVNPTKGFPQYIL